MHKNKRNFEDKPLIGITMGDFNGVGPEIIIKALSDARILRFVTPVIYGSTKVISFYKKLLKNEEFNYNVIRSFDQIHQKKVNLVNCWDDAYEIKPGIQTEEAGKSAYLALKMATEDLKNGNLDGVVTAPINKANIQSDSFQFPGHTEYFTAEFNAEDSLMLLVSGGLRVGVVTGHIPLNSVSGNLTKEKLLSKIRIMEKSLKKDFGITKPKIALLGLNPHAGEDGLLGTEEQDIISPVANECKDKGMLVFGPYPADGFFGMAYYKKFDGVLAMYHDQGLIPFKTIAFENGVNFTAGLSAIRTSPDHGTAFNIAGKGIASEESIREAIFLACEVFRNRQELLQER
jgi:4-hydroxythreonine-4-phosphate dehydrogenase